VSDVRGVTHGVPLVRRMLAEHRRMVLPLLIVLVANVVVYGTVVHPLAQRVANVEQRTRQANEALAAATRERELAHETVAGQARAAQELATFYESVLPLDLAAARRLTYPRLLQLARQFGVHASRVSFSPVQQRDSTLSQLKIDMALSGSYADMRAFIQQLETAQEFVVIDNVRLAEGLEEGGPLQVRLELSTYYRDGTP
jgi:Tfp pilus assembly protein PilO